MNIIVRGRKYYCYLHITLLKISKYNYAFITGYHCGWRSPLARLIVLLKMILAVRILTVNHLRTKELGD